MRRRGQTLKNTMRKWKALSITLLMLALLIAVGVESLPTQVASASGPTAIQTQTKVIQQTTTTTATTTTKDVTWESAGYDIAHMHLWSYFERIVWSYSGGKITAITVYRWGYCYWGGWVFDGNIKFTQSGGNGYSSYTAYTKGQFTYWKTNPDCPSCPKMLSDRVQSWISMTVRADGTYSATSGAQRVSTK